jgi:UrcA family protein
VRGPGECEIAGRIRLASRKLQMRELVAPAALIAGLMLSSGAFAAPAPNSSSAAAAASEPAAHVTQAGRMSMSGAPTYEGSASQPVRYAHLNLASPAELQKLDQRIEAAAAQPCRELRAAYPLDFYPTVSGGNCASSAAHGAEASVGPVVDAAATMAAVNARPSGYRPPRPLGAIAFQSSRAFTTGGAAYGVSP